MPVEGVLWELFKLADFTHVVRVFCHSTQEVSEEGVRDGRIHIPKRVVIDMHKKQEKSCTKNKKSCAPKNRKVVRLNGKKKF
jgi:hypothetical protein